MLSVIVFASSKSVSRSESSWALIYEWSIARYGNVSYYLLYMIFKDFRECVHQLEMALSLLLLGVERAVKTSGEVLLVFRLSALLVFECYRSWLVFVSKHENPCNSVNYEVLKSFRTYSKLLEKHFSVVFSEGGKCSEELTSWNGLTLPFLVNLYFNIWKYWKSCLGKVRISMTLR